MKKKILDYSLVFSSVFVFIIYMSVAICCYFMFGRYIQDNMLLSYPYTSTLMTAVRFMYTIVILLSYPAVLYPIRAMILDYLKVTPQHKKYNLAFYITTLCITIISTGISMGVPSIVEILNFAASIFGIGIYFVLPILSFWYLPHVRYTSRAL